MPRDFVRPIARWLAGISPIRRSRHGWQGRGARFSRSHRRTRVWAEVLEDRCLLANVSWDGGGDGVSWHNPLNWDTDALPSTEDNVFIDVPGVQTIRIDNVTGDVSIRSLDARESLTVLLSSLAVAEASTLQAVSLSNGTIEGSGDVTVTNSASLSGNSRLLGSGRFIVAAGATVSSFNRITINRNTENHGTFDLRSEALSLGGTFTNHVGAELNLVDEADFRPSTANTSVLDNRGFFAKSGSGTSEILFGVQLQNTGTITVSEGELHLSGGGSTTTSIDVPADAVLRFSGGFGFAPGTALTGEGTLLFFSGEYDFSDAQFLATGTAEFRSGTTTIANTLPVELSVPFIGGTMTFNANQTLDSTSSLLATIRGSGDLTLTGTSLLNGLILEGTGAATIAAGAEMSVGGFDATFRRSVENFGKFRVNGNRVSLDEPFINRASAEFILDVGGVLIRASTATETFVNEGILSKVGTGLSRTIGVELKNTGTVTVTDGELHLDTTQPANEGRLEVGVGGELSTLGTLEIAPGGVLTGTGVVDSDVRNAGSVQPGGNIGVLTIEGAYTQTPDGGLVIDIGGRTAGTEYDQLNVTGSAMLEGDLTVELANTFLPGIADSFVLSNFVSISGEFTSTNLADISPLEFVVMRDSLSLTLNTQLKTTTGLAPTFRGTAAADSQVTITADGVPLGTATANAVGRWQFTVPEPLAEPDYSVAVIGTGPARINLTAPLNVGDSPVAELSGLELSDNRISFFPFGQDQDGVLNADDVILTSEASRLALPVEPFVSSGTVGTVQRTYRGDLLLDQDSAGDPAPNYSLINENIVSEFGLASVLPFAIRKFEVRNVDTSNGFSAELFAIGAFGEIDLAAPMPERELAARKAARQHLKEAIEQALEPDLVVIASIQDRWAGYELVPVAGAAAKGEGQVTAQAFTVIELEDGLGQSLRALGINGPEDLKAAEKLIAEAFRFEVELDQLGVRSRFEQDDERGQKFTELQRDLKDAAKRIVTQAAAIANAKENPTEQDFEFVEAILSFASVAEVYDLGVDSVATLIQLQPSIEREITRLQFDAVSLDEILLGINHALTISIVADEDSLAASVSTTKQFIDTIIARVEVDSRNQTPPANAAGLSSTAVRLANTAVQLATDLVGLAIPASDPEHGPKAVVTRIREHVSDFKFDPNNLLPRKRPDPEPTPPGDDPRAFVLLGDLPLDSDGKLTTDGVTDLLRNVPNGVSRFIPLETEFEFSISIDNGALTALNIPTITVGFDNLQLGKTVEAAGFISLGSYAENGEFQRGNFAGGLDIAADIDGFESSLGVTINGTGEDRGFFPDDDGVGGSIVAQAIVDLDFKTPSDLPGFYFDVRDVAAEFDVRLQIDDSLRFAFEEFGLTEITVDRFDAAFGGTAPGENATSPIPTDAFLALASEDVVINFAEDDVPLLTFGSISAQVPNAPAGLGNLVATLRGFGIDVVDGGLDLALADDFGFRFEGVEALMEELGLAEFIRVSSLDFQPGPNFPSDLLDFSLQVDGGISLPDPTPATADLRGLSIDVAKLSQGNLNSAIEIERGLSVSIGPISIGGAVDISIDVELEKIEYDKPGGEIDSAIIIAGSGSLALPGIAGIGIELAWSELGFIAGGLSVNTEIPIGSTGLSLKKVGGRLILNAPDVRPVDVPLDLLAESADPGVVDFSDLSGPLNVSQLRSRTKDLLEENAQQIAVGGPPINTLLKPLLFSGEFDIGITGDPGTMLLETTIGARIDPSGVEPLKLFGLGSLTILPGQERELRLGDAGVLLEFDGDDVTVSAAVRGGGVDDEALKIPAEFAVGFQFSKRDELFELLIQGEVKIDGLTGKDGGGGTKALEAGGILVIEPDIGLYGAVQITVGVNQPGDDLYLGGELFVRFNTDSMPRELAPVLAQSLVPRLVDTTTGQAIIPAGFGVFATVEFGLGDLLEASGTLEIESDPSGLRAALILDGSMFDAAIAVGLDGELIFANVSGDLEFRRLEVDAFIEIILISGFLETRGEGRLLIDEDGLQELSALGTGIFLGVEFGPNGFRVDRNLCVTLLGDGDPIEFPLPGGECGFVAEPEPTRFTVSNPTILERDFGQRTVDVEVTFTGPNTIVVPDSDLIPEGIFLDFWTVSRPDDNAVGFADSGDFRRVDRERVFVQGTEIATLPGVNKLYQLPGTPVIPIDLFGDRQIELDETFSIFVQPVLPAGVQHPTLVRGDGFGRVTIQNDDAEAQPPADAVVFFDFDRLTLVQGPDGSQIPQWQFESGPDVSRPRLTFDVSRVSQISHSVERIDPPPRNGLPRVEDVSRAAAAETWLTRVSTDNVDPDPIGEIRDVIGGGQQTLGDVVEQREYFEFTITPTLTRNLLRVPTGIRVDGIDFHDRADIGGTWWEVRYSRDNFQSVLASGATHGGEFGHNRALFRYPAGQSGNLPGNVPITFRIYGPRPLTVLDTDPLPWHVDNLALFGGTYTVPLPVVEQPPPVLNIGVTTVDNRVATKSSTATRFPPEVTRRTEKITSVIEPTLVFNGLVSDGTVFLDGNGNGAADFIDSNGNSAQDPDELTEPVASTDAGGLFELVIPTEFDVDNNGVIDPSEGLIVSTGGVDLGTELEIPLRFRAPTGSSAVSPLTSVISSLLIRHGTDVDGAHDLVRDGLIVSGQNLAGSADLYSHDPITRINAGAALAVPEYQAIMEVHNTAVLASQAIAGGGVDLGDAGDRVFDAIADELQQSGSLSLTDAVALRRILDAATEATSTNLSPNIAQAIVDVIVNSNSALESVVASPGLGYLKQVKQLQRVVHSTTAGEVLQAASGKLSLAELLSRNSVDNLAIRSDASSAGNIFPVAVLIDHVGAAEPAGGSQDFEFTVSLTAPSNLPVSVDYETRGSTATSVEGDFTHVSGTIIFGPGETLQTIRVPVLADGVDEIGETFHVQLSNPRHALLAALRGVGTIRMPANTTVLPSEIQLGDPLSVSVIDPVEVSVALPGIVDATVDWGDGIIESASLTDESDRVVVRATRRYATTGTFEILVTMTHSTGRTIIGGRSVAVGDIVVNFDTDGQGNPLSAGQIIDDEYGALGLHITTHDPANRPPVIFKSSDPAENDTDLGTPNETAGGPGQGSGGEIVQPGANVEPLDGILTISAGGDAGQPGGGMLIFAWDDPTTVNYLDLLDIDSDGGTIVTVNSNGGTVGVHEIENLGTNSLQRVVIGDEDVSRLEINLPNQGALTQLSFRAEAPPAWQNPFEPLDVNNDTFITPGDVLLIINELNGRRYINGAGELPLPPPPGVRPPFLDVSGDGFLVPGDVLRIINHINLVVSQGEGEGVASAFSTTNFVSLAVQTPGVFAPPQRTSLRSGENDTPVPTDFRKRIRLYPAIDTLMSGLSERTASGSADDDVPLALEEIIDQLFSASEELILPTD